VISNAASFFALLYLYKLVEHQYNRHVAQRAVFYVSIFPTAIFFSAVYSESLFLALSGGCSWRARTGRWAWAGLLGGWAAAERATGVTLVVPLILLFLYGPRVERARAFPMAARPWLRRLLPRYRPSPALAWVLLVPAGLGAYTLALVFLTGNGVAPTHLAGQVLADLVTGRDTDNVRLPMVNPAPRLFPPQPFRSWGAAVVRRAMIAKETAEEQGRKPNPLVDQLARMPRRMGYLLGH